MRRFADEALQATAGDAGPLKFLSLFAGIGGLDLGLERAGMKCIGQVELDGFASAILSKHWPDIPRWGDIREFDYEQLAERPDIVCAGFPCQPVSEAGKRQASRDARWLWPDAWRVIRAIRPDWVLLENVTGLLDRGIDEVLGDLAEGGFDAEWDCLPASAFGARQDRDRVFFVAYPNRLEQGRGDIQERQANRGASIRGSVPNQTLAGWDDGCRCGAGRVFGGEGFAVSHEWAPEPRICRVADGVPDGMDRLRTLGNAVVPQVAEWIARRIMEVSHA